MITFVPQCVYVFNAPFIYIVLIILIQYIRHNLFHSIVFGPREQINPGILQTRDGINSPRGSVAVSSCDGVAETRRCPGVHALSQCFGNLSSYIGTCMLTALRIWK